ncbi:E3 ubiquitin- ligase NRDP1 [Paramuricea clavata]|uniref:E3 ubiquitin- ligase NRDP1 n=1 Tax=Paramuricea clavata TaxID=317549 RepID=A0A7D9K6F2_PARCT|nr:E3 ubiquitin- ligase NRDP1 [Paramuricea clavata]
MTEENKHFHEFGYPDEQFETVVSENLHCAICSCVFKDPVMCKNEHCFCRGCITKHLQNYHTCPSCNQDLTVESLADVPRILRNLLSEQRIRCDHHERGCEEIVQLGNLASHVAVCGKAPVVCANEECSSEINREDQFRHQGEECRFRKVKCQNCEEMGSLVQEFGTSLGLLCEHVEKLNTTVNEMKTGLTAMENRLKETENARSDQAMGNGRSCDQATQEDSKEYGYVVAGGYDQSDQPKNSVEVFDKTTNSWIKMKPMKKQRANASSVVYNGHVLVTGGISDGNHIVSSMEQLKCSASPFVLPSWSNLMANLPRPLTGHRTVQYNGVLIVLGGYDACGSDMIYEIQLHFPFNTKVLAKLPPTTPIKGCGTVLANDKILMFGGYEVYQATAKVTMYDITKNEFKELTPLPYVVCNMATVKCRENVILAGGAANKTNNNRKKTVISYNIETEESTELPPMTWERCECCAIVDGNSLVVMGGHGGMQILRSVEAFDFKTSKWSGLPLMNEGRKGFIAEIV